MNKDQREIVAEYYNETKDNDFTGFKYITWLEKKLTESRKKVNVTLGSVSNSLTIKEVAAKYGEKVKCMFYDYDDNWKESERIVNSSFLKDMEQGAIKNCC